MDIEDYNYKTVSKISANGHNSEAQKQVTKMQLQTWIGL